jgi:hypothetical protein
VTSDTDHFTQHSLHLNSKGKEQGAKKDHINMSWKEDQKLEVSNTVSNNVGKDGDQLIHEEQTNRDQVKKEDKLPSKQTSRQPTARYDDFFYDCTST